MPQLPWQSLNSNGNIEHYRNTKSISQIKPKNVSHCICSKRATRHEFGLGATKPTAEVWSHWAVFWSLDETRPWWLQSIPCEETAELWSQPSWKCWSGGVGRAFASSLVLMYPLQNKQRFFTCFSNYKKVTSTTRRIKFYRAECLWASLIRHANHRSKTYLKYQNRPGLGQRIHVRYLANGIYLTCFKNLKIFMPEWYINIGSGNALRPSRSFSVYIYIYIYYQVTISWEQCFLSKCVTKEGLAGTDDCSDWCDNFEHCSIGDNFEQLYGWLSARL